MRLHLHKRDAPEGGIIIYAESKNDIAHGTAKQEEVFHTEVKKSRSVSSQIDCIWKSDIDAENMRL